jgi:hypothetical protein
VAVSLISAFRPRVAVTVAVAVAVGVLLSSRSGLGAHDVLCLAPALLLVAILFARRYPGERLLLGFAARGRSRRLRPRSIGAGPFARVVNLPRGGLLMGFALAVRPPPCSPAAS